MIEFVSSAKNLTKANFFELRVTQVETTKFDFISDDIKTEKIIRFLE